MRILVVEDYEPLRDSVARGLREQGYAVDEAADGAEALLHLQSTEYDVIVLDIMMPRVDGLSVLKRLREAGNDACVLMMTAKDAVTDRVIGLDGGADDYVIKPVAFDELVARIRSLIRRRHDIKTPAIRIVDLEVDTTARVVRRAGASIELSAREYALLEYMAHRQGQLLTRSSIWENLWDDYTTPMSNVVDVYVSRLRRKIDAPGLTPLIHTRRGQGYMLGEAE